MMMQALESRTLLSVSLSGAGAASLAYENCGCGVMEVAYYDVNDGHLKYASTDIYGILGAAETVDGGTAVGTQLALALDSSQKPGIAYYDAANGDLKYAQFDGMSWTISVIDSKGNVGQNPSLVFDQSDHPRISYYSPTGRYLKM